MELKDITKEAVLVSEDATLKEALAAMVKEQTNALLVIDADGVLAGEVGVPDLLDAVVPEYLDGDSVMEHFATEELFEEAVHDAAERPVSEFMTVDIEPVQSTDGLLNVAATAIAHQTTRIPVVDHDNRPIGIISRRGLKQILAKFLHIKDA